MPGTTLTDLQFGDASQIDGSLSDSVRGLAGSDILRIAAEIREMIAAGRPLCNLTVGDFNPKYFPIPTMLMDGVHRALAAGETNYPPPDGMPVLRKAVADFVTRDMGLRYPIESILIASGARPILYAAYRCVINPGDAVLYTVPSWNNNHYAWISGSRPIEIPTRPEDGFLPTLERLAPHLREARLLAINSPLNPAGTVLDAPRLEAITRAVVEENDRRSRAGEPHLFLLHDGVYGALVFGGVKHHHPVKLVPESAPWVISFDGISKAFAATGLRVGWVLAAPQVVARMRDLIGHMGAWAPRAEQVALAEFLTHKNEVDAFRAEMDRRCEERLHALHGGFAAMKADGYPVDCVKPQGAIYLSLRLDLIGRSVDGVPLPTNESVRRLLLDRAGLAVIPFQAFGLKADTGWFRMSIGAVTIEDIREVFPRLRRLLDTVR